MQGDMTGKTVIITGGNSGIGKSTAVALARMGARTVITARDPQRGQQAVEDIRAKAGSDAVELVLFDLGDLASVRAGAAEILERCDRIDVLINNAGLIINDRRESPDGYEMTFAVNHLGPFLLTVLLLDRIKASAPARIINVSSTAHRTGGGINFDDLQSTQGYNGMAAYGRSKLANIYFTTELARRLEGTGVTANAVHPGAVATGWGRGEGDNGGLLGIGVRIAAPFMLTPDKGARTSVYLASSPAVAGVTGKYFARSREARPTKQAQDAEIARRLWEVSEELVAAAKS